MSAEPEPVTEAIDAVGHIVRTPGVVSGKPRIAGTRIRVIDVAAQHFFHRLSVDEIADQFDLKHADIYAALTYYFDHKGEIEAQERKDAELIERLKAEYPDRTVDRRS
jgi:uncharacterized protein (DUF433 family)